MGKLGGNTEKELPTPAAYIDPHRASGSFNYSVVGCSAIGAIVFVSGACWFFYWICNKTRMPNESQRKHRKTSIMSVSSARSGGDPHAHFDGPPRNPHIYLDKAVSARNKSPMPTFAVTSQFFPSAPGDGNTNPQYPSHAQQYPNFFQQQQLHEQAKQQEPVKSDKPPPYPGGFSYSDVTKPTKLPPPYSA